MKRTPMILGAGMALAVFGSVYAGAASAGDRVNFSISFGIPAPMVYGPPVVYSPPPVVYAPPVYFGPQVVVTTTPRYVVGYRPGAVVSYGYREHRHRDRGLHRGWR